MSKGRLGHSYCAQPRHYDVTPNGHTVGIETKGCASCVLLRKNLATGEVVKIAQRSTGMSGLIADECVPPGTYQYGFDPPYENECRVPWWHRRSPIRRATPPAS